MSADQAHSLYGMSSIKRWTSCLASTRHCENAPSSLDESWTIEGKTAHALLQTMLERREDNTASWIGTAIEYGTEDGLGLMAVITPECARAVQIALDQVYEFLEEYPDTTLWVEQRVEIPSMSVPNRMWGTADILLYSRAAKLLVALDYKHGAGIFVSAQDNLQVKGYALAALLTLVDGPVETVWLGIIQPRSFSAEGSVRWDKKTTVMALLDYQRWLDERALLTLDDGAPFEAEASYCRWCPGASTCAEYELYALSGTGRTSLAEFVARPVSAAATNLPLERLSLLLKAAPFMQGLIKAARSIAFGAAYRGYDIPDFKLVPGEAKRAWYGSHAEIAEQLALVTGLPVDRFFPRTLITLTEAEQVVIDAYRAGIVRAPGETKKSANYRANKASELAREFMAQLTLKEPGAKLSLAPITDPRPRVDAAASNLAGLINVDPQE